LHWRFIVKYGVFPDAVVGVKDQKQSMVGVAQFFNEMLFVVIFSAI